VSDNNTHVGPTSPQALIDELRAEIIAEGDANPDERLTDSGNERALRAPLPDHAADSLITRAVDTLLDNLEVLPTRDMQVRLTETVRLIATNRRTPLPTLLEVGRMEAQIAPEDLARQLSMSPAHLVELETGRRPLWKARRKNSVALVIHWLDLLQIDTASAVRATKRLAVNAPETALAGRDQRDADKAHSFATQLLAALEGRPIEPTSHA